MAEKYFSLSQLKSISRIETNQWNGPSEVCDLYDLKKLPPADVRPVVRGRWEPRDLTFGRSIYECSNCKLGLFVPAFNGKPGYPYCPNCGADMRGGDAE